MATVQMDFMMDEDVKKRMDAAASAIGISTATALNIFARQFVAVGGFPFEVKVPQNETLPKINKHALYQPKRTEDGRPILPSEWRDEEGDIYDSFA